MSDPNDEGEAFRKARNGRNIALFLGLLGFVILVFIVTIVRIGGNVTAHGF
jgi:hypothetical protein